MCGITVYITKNNDIIKTSNMMKVLHRGPDSANMIETEYKDYTLSFVFHRLAIIDLDNGSQPFKFEDDNRIVYLVCNGEIYNYLDIINKYNFETKSDCHVILDMFLSFGIFRTCKELDGEFAFVLIELNKTQNYMKTYFCRDRFGIRPLFYYTDNDGIYFSSELKGLPFEGKGQQVEPRNINLFMESKNKFYIRSLPYYEIGKNTIKIKYLYNQISETLYKSVSDRLQSERPIGALLSGGLDSSLICGIASKLLEKKGQRLNTFTIGMDYDSPDILFARKVSKYINSIHHEIILPVDYWIDALENIIKQIETYDITTIRASTGQYLISKWISENTDIKVILNGDGSDELTSGYLYFFNAPSEKDSHEENIRLLNEIHNYDVLRVDRGISAFGLESRVPFLSHHFVDLYLSIDPFLRNPIKNERSEKYLLRKSFEDMNIIPNDVLFRQKEAFSDAVSNRQKSWYEYIQEYVEDIISDEELEQNKDFKTKESYWYYKIFKKHYPESDLKVKYWLPLWCGEENNGDPSARKLKSLHDD